MTCAQHFAGSSCNAARHGRGLESRPPGRHCSRAPCANGPSPEILVCSRRVGSHFNRCSFARRRRCEVVVMDRSTRRPSPCHSRTVAVLFLILVTASLMGCAGRSSDTRPTTRPPAPAIIPLDGLHAHARVLTAPVFASTVAPAMSFGHSLLRWRYVTGYEIEYVGRTHIFHHVIVRVFLFRHRFGVRSFISWIRVHSSEVLVSPAALRPLALGESGVLLKAGACGCRSDLPTYFGAWTHQSLVMAITASGPGVNRATFAELARYIDIQRTRLPARFFP
jgi:hypothetical protein